MSCPVCGASTKRLFAKYGYPIHECVACHHRYSVPQPGAREAIRGRGDQVLPASSCGSSTGAPACPAEAEVHQRYGWRYAELLKTYMPPGTVFHVGVDGGYILKGMVERGWHGVGLDPNQRLADYGRTQLGLSIATGNLEDIVVNPTKKAPFDLIMMIQVVAHFQDLHKALGNAAILTRPDGFWLIETWDRTSWPAQLCGRYWHEYNPPSTLHWFSPTGLIQLAEQYGFVEVARGRPQKWITGAHVKSRLQGKLQSVPGHQMLNTPLTIIPDQLKIPQPHFDLFWMLLQKRTKPQLYNMAAANPSAIHQQAAAVAFQ